MTSVRVLGPPEVLQVSVSSRKQLILLGARALPAGERHDVVPKASKRSSKGVH